jgi:outer membrane receptor protein involved in Fe transport
MAHNDESTRLFPRRALSVAISTVCAGAATSAMAQDETDENPMLEEIIVTATKREANVQDIPMSVQAFTSDDIVRGGFKALDDYAGQIPSLSYGRREPGGTNVIMRGCAVSGVAFSDNPTTAVYLDEQPITVAGFNPDPRLVDISRVEALSGPQGSLFGDASQCGTLRIITNKPDTTQSERWIDLTASSIKDGDVGYDVSAMFNVPISENTLAMRFVGFYADEAGYIDNVLGVSPGGESFPGGTFNNSEFVEDDINSSTVHGGRLGLRWVPNDNWTIDAQAIYQKTEGDGFGDVDLPDNLFSNNPELGEYEQLRFGDDYWEDEWYQLALTAEGNLGWADLTVATSFMNRKTRYDADSTSYLAAWQELYPYYNIYDFGGDPQAMSFDQGDVDRFSAEIRLSTPADSTSRWSGLIGLFYNEVDDHTHFAANIKGLGSSNAFYYLNYSAFYYNAPVAPTDNWWTGVYNNELEQVALFGEATFDVTDHFSLTVGGRFFDIETDRTLENGTLVAGVNDFTQLGAEINCDALAGGPPDTADLCWTGPRNVASSSESDFVPKITARYTFDDPDLMIYGTYSEGFRRGGGNAARPTSIFGRAPFNQFDSDLVSNYEIGAKSTWADGSFRLNVTAYHMEWDDIQIEAEDPTPGLFTLGIVNFPQATIDGFEVFFDWAPSTAWSIYGNLGYNDAEISETAAVVIDGQESETVAVEGTPLPLVPDWKASLNFEYSFANAVFNADPSLAFGFEYTGDSVNSLAGIQSIEFNNPTRIQPSYSLANLRYALDGPDWTVTLFVNNLFDEYAEQFYNDRWAQTRLTVNRPRTIGINYRKNF